jgi:hypothetical protein
VNVESLAARVAELEATAAQLTDRLAKLYEVDSIMRRAEAPQPVVAAAERKAARSHLTAVK